ncbi:FR47-like protein [Kribbella sp. VKM Ac-2527]|uniref:FR47-like protein n=1 Tax=Kribbella caucasensis TaxID=2512215 RepID=A0A4R6K5L2_9ACTN|nr:GNAT family N-acetyltransferase [Kribbella sp. VKM Ac-2527]TDO44686.1 FR47-like protein [Kribbella sp. VKM Ac-2527]
MDRLLNPAYHALTGPHADLAEARGRVRKYPVDVAPFLGLPDAPTPQDWADAAELVGAGHTVALMRPELPVPDVFKVEADFDLLQYAAPPSFGVVDPEVNVLGADDVPDMLALVALTDPGPFRARTIALGTYLGLRRDGELIAMAGERMHPTGYVEISAVCTHPDHRGQGLATRLLRAVAAGIEHTGAQPFLHTGGTNTTAIRLYESLGFTVTNRMKVTVLQPR